MNIEHQKIRTNQIFCIMSKIIDLAPTIHWVIWSLVLNVVFNDDKLGKNQRIQNWRNWRKSKKSMRIHVFCRRAMRPHDLSARSSLMTVSMMDSPSLSASPSIAACYLKCPQSSHCKHSKLPVISCAIAKVYRRHDWQSACHAVMHLSTQRYVGMQSFCVSF